jgi:hypothetical protein
MDVCVGLVNMNPTQLEWTQIDIVCSSYGDLFVLPNKQKNADCTVRTVPCGSWLYIPYDHIDDVVGTVGKFWR